MRINFKTALRHRGSEPYPATDCHPDMFSTLDKGFDAQAVINDCTLNEALYSLYQAGLMSITLQGNMINTSELSILLGSGLKRKFGKNMPCTLTLSVKDTYPQLYKQEPDPLDKDIPNGAFYLSNQA